MFANQIGKLYFSIFLVLVGIVQKATATSAKCKDQKPVLINEHFTACCANKTSFSSESCMQALHENGTLTEACMVNCLYRTLNLFDGHSMQMAEMEKFMRANTPDAAMHDMFMAAFKRCVEIDEKTPLPQLLSKISPITDDFNCGSYAAYMDRCVWYHTVANCPAAYLSENEHGNCAAKRQWVNVCLLA